MGTELESSFHPFSTLFSEHLQQGAVLGLRTQSGIQTQEGPFFRGAGILVEETGSKRGSKQMLSTGVVCHTEREL